MKCCVMMSTIWRTIKQRDQKNTIMQEEQKTIILKTQKLSEKYSQDKEPKAKQRTTVKIKSQHSKALLLLYALANAINPCQHYTPLLTL